VILRTSFLLLGALPLFAQQYTGSTACKTCHPQVYERWSKTRMANVVRDPKEHPEAIIPDFSKPDPAVTFTKNDIAFVYGSKWKQRYFTKVGNDYFPLGAQWDIVHQKWSAYQVRQGTDWWTAFYPAGNMQRPTGPLCDGCHSVNFNVQNNSVTEWNVGCERCHGPGSEHVRQPAAANIVNPARLTATAATDTCIQCHSQGRPLTNPINGRYYDWPVGFQMGKNLSDYWQLEDHKLGETTFTHFADDTAHKNRMQGNDFVQSVMYTHGVKCSSCHDVHGTANNADTIRPGSQMCLECHSPTSPNGPHAATLEEHSHHKAGSTGNNCLECHMPKIEQTMPDDFVRSHTFRFINPTMTEQYAIPNPCTSCHKDKTTAWAKEALKGWRDRSPWRVAP
jgi:predicted CXXCH cytochrome family protein